jgi:hypothetical protein
MKREILDQFEGKYNVHHFISDNGVESYLTSSRDFTKEASALGACKLNTVETGDKHVLFLFNENNEEVGRYYLGKKLQGQTPEQISEQTDKLCVFESWNPKSKSWVPCVGISVHKPMKDIASKAVSFNESSGNRKTKVVQQRQDEIEFKGYELTKEEIIEKFRRDIIRPKTTVADEYRRKHKDYSFGLVDKFDYKESFKKHALSIMMLRPGIEFLYYAPNEIKPLWMYNGELYCDQDNSVHGASAFIWIMQHYKQLEDFCYLLDLLDEQIADRWQESLKEPEKLINEIKRNIPSFKLGNNQQSVKIALGWAWIDLQAILHFIDYCTNNLNDIPKRNKHNLQECSSIDDLADLFLSDMHIRTNGHQDSVNNQDVELPF